MSSHSSRWQSRRLHPLWPGSGGPEPNPIASRSFPGHLQGGHQLCPQAWGTAPATSSPEKEQRGRGPTGPRGPCVRSMGASPHDPSGQTGEARSHSPAGPATRLAAAGPRMSGWGRADNWPWGLSKTLWAFPVGCFFSWAHLKGQERTLGDTVSRVGGGGRAVPLQPPSSTSLYPRQDPGSPQSSEKLTSQPCGGNARPQPGSRSRASRGGVCGPGQRRDQDASQPSVHFSNWPASSGPHSTFQLPHQSSPDPTLRAPPGTSQLLLG